MKRFAISFALLCAAVCSFAQTNNARMLSGINRQNGTPYSFVAQDSTRITVFTQSFALSVALASGLTQGFGAGNEFSAQMIGSGSTIITCSSCLIYSSAAPTGSSTLTLTQGQNADLYSDGQNYYAALNASGWTPPNPANFPGPISTPGPMTVGAGSPGVSAVLFNGPDPFGLCNPAGYDQVTDVLDPATGSSSLAWNPNCVLNQRLFTTAFQAIPYAQGNFWAYDSSTGLPIVVQGSTINPLTGQVVTDNWQFQPTTATALGPLRFNDTGGNNRWAAGNKDCTGAATNDFVICATAQDVFGQAVVLRISATTGAITDSSGNPLCNTTSCPGSGTVAAGTSTHVGVYTGPTTVGSSTQITEAGGVLNVGTDSISSSAAGAAIVQTEIADPGAPGATTKGSIYNSNTCLRWMLYNHNAGPKAIGTWGITSAGGFNVGGSSSVCGIFTEALFAGNVSGIQLFSENGSGVPAWMPLSNTAGTQMQTSSGSLTTNCVPIFNASGDIVCSLASDSGSAFAYTGAGGYQATGGYSGIAATTFTQFLGGFGTSATNGSAGGALFAGASNSSNGSSAKAGPAELQGGPLINATPNAAALEGVVQISSGFLKGTAVANVGDVVCSTTTAFTTTDCSHTGPVITILGIAATTTNPIIVVNAGQALVKTDGAVTLGDILCMGATTDGLAHDNGTAVCATAGTTIGVVIADAGTITVINGSQTVGNVAMSTTLPLVQLHLGK